LCFPKWTFTNVDTEMPQAGTCRKGNSRATLLPDGDAPLAAPSSSLHSASSDHLRATGTPALFCHILAEVLKTGLCPDLAGSHAIEAAP